MHRTHNETMCSAWSGRVIVVARAENTLCLVVEYADVQLLSSWGMPPSIALCHRDDSPAFPPPTDVAWGAGVLCLLPCTSHVRTAVTGSAVTSIIVHASMIQTHHRGRLASAGRKPGRTTSASPNKIAQRKSKKNRPVNTGHRNIFHRWAPEDLKMSGAL
ncbi:hypothetical protein BC834DRAFT_884762 [Gloeopeniophorella convolvens]|nr:hypothetical protein BC834DRAFT_884762 [Gloeopeniophorella convolvens]